MKTVTLLITLLAASACYPQSIPLDEAASYNFIHPQLNSISSPANLDSFYAKLARIKKEGTGQVSIVHLGDSHIQADLLTAPVRNRLQAFFGNAGRGLVFPYQLARSNAPPDISASSPATWQYNRLAHPEIALATGISGFCIQSSGLHPVINLSLKQAGDSAQAFTHIRIFTGNSHDTSLVLHTDNSDAEILLLPADTSPYMEAELDNPVTGFSLYPSLAPFQFYGASLERADAGVRYHTIGVNGATYGQFNKSLLFWQQLPALQADLYIVSMGTNEAQKARPDLADFNVQLLGMVNKIRAASPEAAILFTSPADSYFGGRSISSSMKKIRDALADFCMEHQIAFWDLYTITGGYGSASSWQRNGLLNRDRVHYIKPGYEVQGNLLFTALSKGYNLYLKRFENQ